MNILVCASVKSMPVCPVLGSKKGECSDCRAAVWIAPSSKSLPPDFKPICRACVGKLDKYDVQLPTKAQLDEVRRSLDQSRQ